MLFDYQMVTFEEIIKNDFFKWAQFVNSHAKIMQTSAMKACFQIAECSLSSAKIMPMSAMKACFQIAECSLSSAKIALLSVTEDHSDVKKK